MKKLLFLSIVWISLLAYANAQSMDEILANMPDDIIPMLSQDNRTMLLVDSASRVVPTMLGEIEKVESGNDFIELRTSATGTTQIKKLLKNDSSFIIGVIKTVCAPACDSNIRFYDSDWEEIEQSEILPKINRYQFFSDLSADQYDKVFYSLPDLYPVMASFNKSSELVLKLDLDNYLSKAQLKEINEVHSIRELTFKWDSDSFR